jgi:hypothetical protein
MGYKINEDILKELKQNLYWTTLWNIQANGFEMVTECRDVLLELLKDYISHWLRSWGRLFKILLDERDRNKWPNSLIAKWWQTKVLKLLHYHSVVIECAQTLSFFMHVSEYTELPVEILTYSIFSRKISWKLVRKWENTIRVNRL